MSTASLDFWAHKELVLLPGKNRRSRIVVGYRCQSCGYLCKGATADEAMPAMEQHMAECPSLDSP